MAVDLKSTVQNAVAEQKLVPITISEELEQKYLKNVKSSAIKLIPVSFIVAAVAGLILFLLVYFLRIIAISALAFFCIIFPIYAVYDAIATSKAIKKHDYEFFSGEIVGKTDNNYIVKGLEDQKASILFGKDFYANGDKAIVARIKDDLNLISEG